MLDCLVLCFSKIRQEIEAVTAALRDGWLAPGPRAGAKQIDLKSWGKGGSL